MTKKSKAPSKTEIAQQKKTKIQTQTKIIDLFEIKKSNISDSKIKIPQNLNNNFICRIMPKNSKKQIMVKYQECKKHFPLALLDFYQNHMKLKKKILQQKDILSKLPQVLEQNVQQSNSESHPRTQNSQSSLQKDQIQKNEVLKIKNDSQKKQNFQSMLDYDSIISNRIPIKKKIQVVFSSQQRQTNPYIKQLQQFQKKDQKKPQKQRKQSGQVHDLRSRKKIKQ